MGMLRLREETRFARDHACVSWDLSSGSSIAESSAHGCAMGVILCVLSRVPLFATPLVHQAPLSMEFPRQEYWSGLPLPRLGDLPDPGIKSASLVSPALTGGFLAWGQVGVGRASHQLEGLSGGSEKLTLLGSKCEPRAGFPELEMEVGGRVSGREDCRSEGQLVGVTWVTWKECTCDWEGTGFG